MVRAGEELVKKTEVKGSEAPLVFDIRAVIGGLIRAGFVTRLW